MDGIRVLLACGDRDYLRRDVIRDALTSIPTLQIVVHGAQRGADTLAEEVAEELGKEVHPYRANWSSLGKRAGPSRNARMLLEGKPDAVFAFHDHLKDSRGTRNMLQQALTREVPCYLFANNDLFIVLEYMDPHFTVVKLDSIESGLEHWAANNTKQVYQIKEI